MGLRLGPKVLLVSDQGQVDRLASLHIQIQVLVLSRAPAVPGETALDLARLEVGQCVNDASVLEELLAGSEFKLEEGDGCGLEVLEVREGDDGVLVVLKVLDETLARIEDCAFHGRIDLGDRYDLLR